MRPWTIAVIGVGLVVIAAVVIYFVVKKRKAEAEEKMEENLGEDGPPGSYDTPGLDDLAQDLVEGTVKTTLDIAWSGAKAIASPVAEPIGNALWNWSNADFDKRAFIAAWEGKRVGIYFKHPILRFRIKVGTERVVAIGPGMKEMFYQAAWRTDPELKEEVAKIPGLLGQLEEQRGWLVEEHLVPEEEALYIPPAPAKVGERFVLVEAWPPEPFIKAGEKALMTLVWRNDTKEYYQTKFRLKLRHRRWHTGDTVEAGALPGETKATTLTCDTQSDWDVGDFLDAEIWWKSKPGSWIGPEYERVWEQDEAYMIVEQPVELPFWMY